MQLAIQTSVSELVPIGDMQYLYDLAKCSKCQMFILLKSTNKLYGASDDCSSIHEIDVPFLVSTDLEFRLDSIDKNAIYQSETYFIPNRFPWVILPGYYWDMYSNGDIYTEYNSEKDIFNLYDGTTKQIIPDQIHMYKRRVQFDSGRNSFINQLFGYLSRVPNLLSPYTFNHMESNPTIRKAYDSKAALGCFLCKLIDERVSVLFYFYKSLFALSKSDTLDIDIRFDRFCPNEFMATFRPKKKKNPLTYNKYGVPFSEQIHCMYRNLV